MHTIFIFEYNISYFVPQLSSPQTMNYFKRHISSTTSCTSRRAHLRKFQLKQNSRTPLCIFYNTRSSRGQSSPAIRLDSRGQLEEWRLSWRALALRCNNRKVVTRPPTTFVASLSSRLRRRFFPFPLVRCFTRLHARPFSPPRPPPNTHAHMHAREGEPP